MYGESSDWQLIENDDQLKAFLHVVNDQNLDSVPSFIGLYADKEVPYGRIVELLNLGSENGVKVVLATSAPSSVPARPAEESVSDKRATDSPAAYPAAGLADGHDARLR